MTLYNLSIFKNTTDIGGIITTANTYSGGVSGTPMLIPLFLIVIFFVLFFGLKRYEFKDSLLASSFTTLIISVFFWSIGLLNPLISFVFLFLLAGGYALHYIETNT